METMILLNFNNIKHCTFCKYLTSDKTEKNIFDKKVFSYIKKFPIKFSRNISDMDRQYLMYQKYINHIIKESDFKIIENCNNILRVIRRKYYKSFYGVDTNEISCLDVCDDFVIFIEKKDNGFKYFDLCSKKEFLRIQKYRNSRCCSVTKHAMERIKVRAIGQVKNLISDDLSKYENNLINYINNDKHVFEIKMKDKYRIVNLLNNNLEESNYYTNKKMVFVVANKVLITSYSYWEDKYEVV